MAMAHNTHTKGVEWRIHTALNLWFSTKLSQMYVEEKTTCSTNGVGKTGYPHVEDWNEIPISLTLLNNQFKLIKDFNIKPEILKLLWENPARSRYKQQFSE
jgi:hypothetical protein